MPSLPAGPTSDPYANSTGDTTITPTSQNYTADVTFSGSARTSNLSIATTGLDSGATIRVLCIFGATAEPLVVNLKNSNGTLMFTFTKSGSENAALFVVESTGNGGLRQMSALIPAYS